MYNAKSNYVNAANTSWALEINEENYDGSYLYYKVIPHILYKVFHNKRILWSKSGEGSHKT